jgi:type I restriction enzyme S subunit
MKNDWKTKEVGDVAEVGAGNSAPQDESLFKDGTYPFFRTADAGRVRFGDIYESGDYLNEEGVRGLRRYPKGTILFPKSGASTFLNHRVMLGVDGYVASHLATIVADEAQVNARFLLYFLSTVAAQDLVQDHAYPSLNLPTIAGICVQAPPLPEQQRIVDILDKAFEGIASAKANAKKNLQNARALFESHLQSVFAQRGKGWVETKLDDVTDLITCGVAKRPEYVPEGIPFLSAKNVKNGQVVWSGHQYVSEETHRALIKNNKPRLGDILYTRVGSYGEAAIIDRDIEFSIFVSLTLIKPKPVVLNSFLKYYLNSSAIKVLAADSITGSGVGNLNVGTVREFPIHLPQLAEQRSIVTKLDDLSEKTQRLATLYQRKLAALEALKKSLLHQAFSGEL